MNNEKCAICHEEMTEGLYTLPECNHTFHTNCIMTWFRLKNTNNKCPLCNNPGVNHLSDLDNLSWQSKLPAEQNYKRMRAFSRRKDAPKELKNMVKKLKKLEVLDKERAKEFKEFKASKIPDLTVQQIQKKYSNFRRKRWQMYRRIRRQKTLIGFQQNITNIIIPVKQVVN